MFHRQRVMWAELRNARTAFLVASADWESIIFRGRGHWHASEDRWDEVGQSWHWTDQEDLRARCSTGDGGIRGVSWRPRVDLDGGAVAGNSITRLQDALTNRERTDRLVAFLREGAFDWRFVVEEWKPVERTNRAP